MTDPMVSEQGKGEVVHTFPTLKPVNYTPSFEQIIEGHKLEDEKA
jgi:hypothetical protein